MGELSNQQPGEQSAGDRSEAERSDLEPSDPVAGGYHQEQGELRVAH